jgi:predicted Zn-dependent protease with MMP-like domain
LITPEQSAHFDAMVEAVINDLPPRYAAQLAHTPIIVLDRPDAAMLADLEIDPANEEAILELCGLHTGVATTETSVEDSGSLPSAIHIFREGVLALVGEEATERRSDEATEGERQRDGETQRRSGGGERRRDLETQRQSGEGEAGEVEKAEMGDDAVFEQIRITILHELGHQFGLDEDDLFELGYE